MKKSFISMFTYCFVGLLAIQLNAQTTSASSNLIAQPFYDRLVPYKTADTGVLKPMFWGMDAGGWTNDVIWNGGIQYAGAENMNITRIPSFATDTLYGDTLQARQKAYIRDRLNMITPVGHPMQIMLNPGGNDAYYSRDAVGLARTTRMMELTKAYIESFGHTVVAVTGYNEPDYNSYASGQDYYDLIAALKQRPGFANVRFAGCSTLNPDFATGYYNYVRPAGLNEGGSHQLAGSFDSYAYFFSTVKGYGDYASNDEVHNIMESMLGGEYGNMRTGIFWGYANRARGEFVKASNGRRLSYSEHRYNFMTATVFRQANGALQAFGGASERQATTTTFNYVSRDKDVYYEGYGPQREYSLTMPGGNGYGNNQPSAERVIDITYGEDIQPALKGRYILVNRNSGKVVEVPGGSTANAVFLTQNTYAGAAYQQWNVNPINARSGGDFGYFNLTAAHSPKSADLYGFALADGAGIASYDSLNGGNQWYYFEYAGDGYFYIRNRHSAKCLDVQGSATTDGASIVQNTKNNSSLSQQWRLIPVDATVEFTAPGAPTNLTATGRPESVLLNWTASTENDVAGYNVYRAESAGGPYNTIARTVQGTAFIDNTVTTTGTYYYKVKAIDKSLNRSGYSNQVSATTSDAHALVQYLPFNTNLWDSSGNMNQAAGFASPAYTAGALQAGSLTGVQLNGSTQFIQLPATVANQQEITIAAWVNWNGGGAWQRIFDFGNDQSQNMFLTPSSGSGTLRLSVSNNSPGQDLNAPALPIGVYTHVAVTMGPLGVTMYVNGQVVAQSSTNNIRPIDFKPVLNYIGRSQYPDPLFNGAIDEFRIYNYALSASEIQALLTPVILPLTWGGFEAEKRGAISLLTWKTLKEHNVSQFIVEKSTDGNKFIKISTVKAAGESNTPNTYTLTDAAPVEGLNYYRIRQVDKDGQSTYSAVKSLAFVGLPAIVSISPNPVKGTMTLAIPGNSKTLQAVLLNSEGRKVDAFAIKGQIATYDVSKHPAGIYYLQIEGSAVKTFEKFVIGE